MINSNQILNPFVSNEFVHIGDIILLDEPILSHYIRKEKNYFLYLVDKKSKSDRYLLFEINNWILCEYLCGNISLLETISKNEDFIHLLDIDFEGNLINEETFDFININQDFLPIEDSTINFKPIEESFYSNLIDEHNRLNYINNLKKDAFYLKINPVTSKYGHTVSLKEMSETIFKKVSESYAAFSKADFTNKFEKIYTNLKKFNKNFTIVTNENDFRLVDAGINSFEIGLAVDRQTKMIIEDSKLRDWAINVGYDFKTKILETDYSNNEQVDLLLEKFSPEQRKKIFSPMFDIIENKNVDFQIKDNKKAKYKSIKIKDKYILEKIIPKEIKENEIKETDLELIQITTLVQKGKDLKSVKIDNNTLFSSINNSDYTLKYNDFVNHGYDKIDKNIEIKLKILTNSGSILFQADYDDILFEEVLNSEKLDDGITIITKRISEYILMKE